LKSFCIDRRFDVLCTGSLLGVKGYGYKEDEKPASSVPVGYETIEQMYPLDFEEFLWAAGLGDSVLAYLEECIENKIPVSKAVDSSLKNLFLQYIVVGGMPEAVSIFSETHDMGQVLGKQRSILDEYKDDMVKYADTKDKPRIRECFESIPRQLARENKKFMYSVVRKGGRSSQYEGSLQWLEDAGIIKRCYNLTTPQLPLDGNADSAFKVYMTDTGLFTAMLEKGTQGRILRGDLYQYKGAIFENLIAETFSKMGRSLFYFHKDSGLEIGFVINHKGEATLVEVKAASGNAKSAKTILSHPDIYHVGHAIKLGNYNIGESGSMLTLPSYMAFLLKDDPIDIIVPEVDVDNLNRIAESLARKR